MEQKPTNLLLSLINVSEKAANIARICRVNPQLLSLLVQEKTGAEANARFQHDFKTLADVLIQETIKHDIGKKFPEMHEAIKGEESPSFTNNEGKTISIRVGSTIAETVECLGSIIQGEEFKSAIQALADEVHKSVEYNGPDLGVIPDLPKTLNYANLGIWIDPIDATAEYINGLEKSTSIEGIAAAGLDCVTVLIGVYERDNGLPVLGVVSQPFNKGDGDTFQSRLYWGVALPELKIHNLKNSHDEGHEKPIGIFSSSENSKILNLFEEENYEIVFSAGAGHKALKVVKEDADIYLLSKCSTFKWDTCAPQAILRALNGDIFDFVCSVRENTLVPINYAEKSIEGVDEKCNAGGIIAVRDLNILNKILPKLSNI